MRARLWLLLLLLNLTLRADTPKTTDVKHAHYTAEQAALFA